MAPIWDRLSVNLAGKGRHSKTSTNRPPSNVRLSSPSQEPTVSITRDPPISSTKTRISVWMQCFSLIQMTSRFKLTNNYSWCQMTFLYPNFRETTPRIRCSIFSQVLHRVTMGASKVSKHGTTSIRCAEEAAMSITISSHQTGEKSTLPRGREKSKTSIKSTIIRIKGLWSNLTKEPR